MSDSLIYNRFLRVCTAAALVLSLFACKKKETTTEKSYLSGGLKFDSYVPFHTVKQPVTVKVSGVVHPAGNKLYCYYSFNDKKDTLWVDNDKSKGLKEFTKAGENISVTMPESIGDYSLVVHIFPADADKYYETSATASFTVVDPQKSITDIDFSADPFFVDPRDGKKYYYSEVAGTSWMKTNLAYAGTGTSYYSEVMDPLFGRYYTFQQAKSACPSGWTLPSDADFAAFANAVGGRSDCKAFEDFKDAAGLFISKASFNGTILWPYNPKVKIDPNPRFAALPAGFVNSKDSDKDNRYRAFEELGAFWTSDVNPGQSGQAMYRVLNLDSPVCMSASADVASMAMNVRCIRK